MAVSGAVIPVSVRRGAVGAGTPGRWLPEPPRRALPPLSGPASRRAEAAGAPPGLRERRQARPGPRSPEPIGQAGLPQSPRRGQTSGDGASPRRVPGRPAAGEPPTTVTSVPHPVPPAAASASPPSHQRPRHGSATTTIRPSHIDAEAHRVGRGGAHSGRPPLAVPIQLVARAHPAAGSQQGVGCPNGTGGWPVLWKDHVRQRSARKCTRPGGLAGAAEVRLWWR